MTAREERSQEGITYEREVKKNRWDGGTKAPRVRKKAKPRRYAASVTNRSAGPAVGLYSATDCINAAIAASRGASVTSPNRVRWRSISVGVAGGSSQTLIFGWDVGRVRSVSSASSSKSFSPARIPVNSIGMSV